ncbi:MAG TPA: CehA/McbA family metallohydrolase [Thermoplasmata archaeon]|nr:CehA/McbA family metallohydrolase [Thermoplasmata archaeon]
MMINKKVKTKWIFCVSLIGVLFATALSNGGQAQVAYAGGQDIPPGVNFYIEKQKLLGGMNLYFGNLHSHTACSDGEGTPEQAFAWARDVIRFDFYAITDHAEQLSSKEWEEIGKQADKFNTNGRFVAIRGFEWSHPYEGHSCVWNTRKYISAWGEETADTYSKPTLGLFYRWIDDKDAVAQFNHPGRPKGIFRNLHFESDAADNIIAIETGNKGTGNNDGSYYRWYPIALDKGWKVAPTNNLDNHKLVANPHRTVAIAPLLNRDAILDAMKERRAYSTDDGNMEVIFKSGDCWMGSTLRVPSPTINFDVVVEDDEPIVKLEILTNGGKVVAEKNTEANQVVWKPSVESSSGTYFFLRVFERNDRHDDDNPTADMQIAVTAPIWNPHGSQHLYWS